ncbi:hypothetical protein C8N32_102237 [Rhodovulum imhoffii]|uniref:Uncharacterized protein n=1 Tax=Rhodovulum imhoffii TaxID=365340 RepID=A0A2T5BVU7_9RHOB|nr:hypothetical protein C8N32_102237 [Rhodovulum imhoffii]
MLSLVLLLSACAAPQPARWDYVTWHGARIQRDTGIAGQFRVLVKPGYGPTEYWCAAGDYAKDELDLGPGERIYLAAPRDNEGVLFSVLSMEEPEGPRGYSKSLSRPGFSLRVIHARMGCRSLMPFYFDLGRN